MAIEPHGLPGGDLIERGIHDLSRQVPSIEALLVSIGEPRLTRLGVRVPSPVGFPERTLYERLREREGDNAHSCYNALIRRLVNYERAVACAR
jgi:hypothetical protein